MVKFFLSFPSDNSNVQKLSRSYDTVDGVNHHTHTCISPQALSNISIIQQAIIDLCSPCNDIRCEAHHKCANECTDFLGGPLPPPLLLIQAFLAYTAKAHRYHYLPGRHDHRHADIMRQPKEKTYGVDMEKALNCALSQIITFQMFTKHRDQQWKWRWTELLTVWLKMKITCFVSCPKSEKTNIYNNFKII